jgi:hypothetical protein
LSDVEYIGTEGTGKAFAKEINFIYFSGGEWTTVSEST